MSIKGKIHNLADRLGLGLFDPPIPATTTTLTGSELARRVDMAGRYRLVDADGSRPRAVDGQWPLITSVSYLKDGEDGKPTVYITAEDDPDGSFPVPMGGLVAVIPPN